MSSKLRAAFQSHAVVKFKVKFQGTLAAFQGEGSITLRSLAVALESVFGVPVRSQQLIYKGVKLDDLEGTLAQAGVKDGAKLMLIGNATAAGDGVPDTPIVLQPVAPPVERRGSANNHHAPPNNNNNHHAPPSNNNNNHHAPPNNNHHHHHAPPSNNKAPPPPSPSRGDAHTPEPPSTPDELFRAFQGRLIEAQQQYGKPHPPPGSPDQRFAFLLSKGREGVEQLQSLVDDHVRALASLCPAADADFAATHLPPVLDLADAFCTNLQVYYFDPVVTDNVDMRAQRKACNKSINALLARLTPDAFLASLAS